MDWPEWYNHIALDIYIKAKAAALVGRNKSYGLLIFIGVYGWNRMHFARLKNDNKIKVINEPICDVILSLNALRAQCERCIWK